MGRYVARCFKNKAIIQKVREYDENNLTSSI